MAKYILRYLFLFGVSFIVACKKFSPKLDTPSYISIPSYNVIYKSTYANGGPGTTNHKFTDVTVTVNGVDYGIFPIPCKVPIPASGSASVNIKPVIKVNGVASLRSEYSPIKLFDTTVVLERGKVTEVKPTFDYYATGVTFYWVEDFEITGSSLVGDTAIKLQTADKFEGAKAVKIELRNGQSSCMAYSSSTFALPTGGRILYLEVNYKCNQPFDVGLLDANKNIVGGSSAGGAKPSGAWNKIYIFLTPVASGSPQSAYYVYFYFNNKAEDFENNGVGANPTVLIDNIKVVSQP
ncbi:MAG: hypothetical protein Q8M29_16455 [Bacteroidota bacterium]|nr:hypothetical protein [Bacteroidota bacterium]